LTWEVPLGRVQWGQERTVNLEARDLLMHLTPEQKKLGRENFYNAVGATRRDFLQAAMAAVPAGGAITAYLSRDYFGYGDLQGGPVRAGL
jgi:hypothetical protein